ncbi:MAG: hypothetical protein ACLQVJ_20140 [Syntrophobacteraceae bacterium]
MENIEKRKSLRYFPVRREKCWKQPVKFAGNPEDPGLNGGRHKSRWRNYRGGLHLHGDEMHTPEWRKKNKGGRLMQVFCSCRQT